MPPLMAAPAQEELEQMIGPVRYTALQSIRRRIEALYEMDIAWNTGGKAWVYEYKYRRGGKTLCTLYMRPDTLGFLVVLGRAEQEKFEQQWAEFSPAVQEAYEATKVYHDGRWLMLLVKDDAALPDIERLLQIKRRPNKKT